jgi:F-type H+-transporting ATPase subunit epsilon
MNFFTVDILTPYKVIVRDIPAEAVLVPTKRGQINLLPEHTHLISSLSPGILSIFGGADDTDRHFTITKGLLKVLGNKVQILTDVAEESREVNAERAKRALAFAEDKLKSTDGMSDDEIAKFQRKVERAKLRIQLATEYITKK